MAIQRYIIDIDNGPTIGVYVKKVGRFSALPAVEFHGNNLLALLRKMAAWIEEEED